jgi:alpha-L-rhamnosidase
MKNVILTFHLLLIFIASPSCKNEPVKSLPVKLKCEYLFNPVGIDEPNPRLMWQISDERRGAEQTAYRIIVGTDSSEVSGGKGLWDSGRIRSGACFTRYGGPVLEPFTRYYWKVIIRDQEGNLSENKKPAFFETGMMKTGNWKGQWISDSRDISIKPAPYFRKTFEIRKKVKSARQYIAVGGLYELYINGKKSGDAMLDPAFTRYDRRVHYITHDITPLIHEGVNVTGVLLGNGWYNHQSTAVWYFHEAPWRNRPRFCSDLRITYEDGTLEIISTDPGWKTSLSPVIFNSIYTAEHYDARLEQPGWNTPDFDDSKWNRSIPVSSPAALITAQVMHPIRITEEIPAVNLTRPDKSTWVFDIGRNISGISSIRVSGEAGTVIRLKHTERLDEKGYPDPSNIDVHYRPVGDSDPFQTDIFILSGKGEETFRPHFNYKGFQYVGVTSSKPVKLSKESLTGYFMHSDVPPAGKIRSSNELLDKIWLATNNSYLSNLFGYPTDCPQREKNGWTGDAQIAAETGLYNFDGITIYEKYLRDHQDEQQPNGVLPAIIPTSGWGYEWANGPDWTSTIAIIPWNIYLFYGDTTLLSSIYENLKRYVDHITDISPAGLTDWGLGDWIPIRSVASKELTSSVYYFTDATILSKAAKIFGKQQDYEKYSELAARIRNAINDKYLDRSTGIYAKGFQTELCVPLKWGVVPDEMRDKVASNLVAVIEKNGNSMDVGLLGTKAILNALSENGYADLAYSLASRDSFPSWGWWIVNGATTLYENWPLDSKRDISMNHIMFGEIGAWMYKALGGIFPDEENPGFKNVILKPNFVKGLDHFEAEHEGPYGKIISSWKRNGNSIDYRVVIPPSSTATLSIAAVEILENGARSSSDRNISVSNDGNHQTMKLKSGTYSFKITM